MDGGVQTQQAAEAQAAHEVASSEVGEYLIPLDPIASDPCHVAIESIGSGSGYPGTLAKEKDPTNEGSRSAETRVGLASKEIPMNREIPILDFMTFVPPRSADRVDYQFVWVGSQRVFTGGGKHRAGGRVSLVCFSADQIVRVF